VIDSTLMVAGWCVAVGAMAGLVLARRALGARCEAVAQACHELRGPLTAVLLGLEPADRQGGLPPARIRAIELELARAALAVEDLECARGGRADPNRAELVDVRDLLADSVEAWRASAAWRKVGLRVTWSGPRALVTGHRLRLAQATGNLIANAIEHGGEDVLVSGRVRARCVRIEVLDRGPGLSEPVAELIRRRKPGPRHGHGLRIADAIATAHGGRLVAAPSVSGARLVLELPTAWPPGSAHGEPR
jgi:signal transduction histidine kinase